MKSVADRKGHPASMSGTKVTVNNVTYKHSELGLLPDGFTLADSKVIEVYGGFAFSSKHAFLSNLYSCDITINGQHFDSSERAYQYSRALHLGAPEIAHKVLAAKSPKAAKKEGARVESNHMWDQKKRSVLKMIATEKFTQNDVLKAKLLSTGSALLIEATYDTYWGSGSLLGSKLLQEGKWTGMNEMGGILGEIREDLKREDSWQSSRSAAQTTQSTPSRAPTPDMQQNKQQQQPLSGLQSTVSFIPPEQNTQVQTLLKQRSKSRKGKGRGRNQNFNTDQNQFASSYSNPNQRKSQQMHVSYASATAQGGKRSSISSQSVNQSCHVVPGAPPHTHVSHMAPPSATTPPQPLSAGIPQQQHHSAPQTTGWGHNQAQASYNANFDQNVTATGMNIPMPLAQFMSYLPGFLAASNMGYPYGQMHNSQYNSQVAATTMAMPVASSVTPGNVLPMPNTTVPPPNITAGVMTIGGPPGNSTGYMSNVPSNSRSYPTNNANAGASLIPMNQTNTHKGQLSTPTMNNSSAQPTAQIAQITTTSPPTSHPAIAQRRTSAPVGNETGGNNQLPAVEKLSERVEQPMNVSHANIPISGPTAGVANASNTGSANKDRNEVPSETRSSTSPIRPHDVTINIGSHKFDIKYMVKCGLSISTLVMVILLGLK